MKPKKYRVLRADRANEKVVVGSYVYDQWGPDYGLSNEDTRFTGIEHITVTLNEKGEYPGFTIPREDIEEIFVITEGSMRTNIKQESNYKRPDSPAPKTTKSEPVGGSDGWEANAKYLLDSYEGSVRSCYKHGQENLLDSLVITFIEMRDKLSNKKKLEKLSEFTENDIKLSEETKQFISDRLIKKPDNDFGDPVGETSLMPGASGFTFAAFKASDVPPGTKLYMIKEENSE